MAATEGKSQAIGDATRHGDPGAASDHRGRTMVAPALAEALEVVGDRWTLLIVAALLGGARRFGELQEELDGIAPNVLSARLRRLIEQRLVVAEPYSRRPERFVYELTESGRGLAGTLRMLTEWGTRQGGGATALHLTCGTPLEAVWYCRTCGEPVADDEAGELDYA